MEDTSVEKLTLEQYKDIVITVNNCIPLNQEIGGKKLYLKDYSKLITVVEEDGIFEIPKRFSEKEIVIIEEPSKEEKLILAGSSTPWKHLLAIVEGRKLLVSKSKEEALEFCQGELAKMTKDFVFSHGTDSQVSEKEQLTTFILGYLDGTLYQETNAFLSMCFNMKGDNTLSKKEELVISEEKEENSQPEIVDSIFRTEEKDPTPTESVDVEKEVAQETTLNNDAYQKMVEEVVGNNQKESLDIDTAVSLLNQEAVPVNPESAVVVPVAPQTIIPVADTLAQMMNETNTTAYASSVGSSNS